MTDMPSETTRSDRDAAYPLLHFDVFTLFPPMFAGPLDESILKRARSRGIIDIALHDIRDWATDRHRTVDDAPYGGGAGMVMMAPPVVHAVEETLGGVDQEQANRTLILSPAGRLFDQHLAVELARCRRIALICGHYEGIDDRVGPILGADEISIGDYILTGGELAAMVVIDAVSRLVPGVISEASVGEETHDSSLVEYPHYTRPLEFRGHRVPEILLSGHHARIADWRRRQAIQRTSRRRPDLLTAADLSPTERALLVEESDADPGNES